MKRIRYLSLLALLLCGASAWGQDDGFNPDSPAEPGPASTRLVLRVSPGDAGYTSGSGRYVPQAGVSVRAYEYEGFIFTHWTDSKGNVVSRDQYFTFTKTDRADTLTACYTFDPDNPQDPQDPKYTLYRRLTLSVGDGGSASGGGRYLTDNVVRLYAYPNDGFDFGGWYDGEGNLLSTSNPYDYTTTSKNVTLTAHFRFNPDNPAEPVDPQMRPKHYVMATATDGGTVNFSSTRQQEGKSVYMEARCNEGYVFDGWYSADTLYTRMASFSYTMGAADASFEARFRFDPDSPTEPSSAAAAKYSSIYLMNIVGKPGDTVRFPVYLNAMSPLCDMSLQLTFDPALKPRLDSVAVSAKAAGYTVSCSAVNDTVYAFSLIGDTIGVTNTPIVTFDVQIPDTTATGRGYPVKVNQVSVTLEDGTATTTSTRNGRVSVYKLGDSNGDDVVNIFDSINVKNYILDREVKTFIKEVSDVSADDLINVFDLTKLKNVILDNQ